jgi:hypothetical protein
MEAVDSEVDDERLVLAQDDVEMIYLPDNICAKISNEKWMKDVPEDIYTLPDMTQISADQVMDKESNKTVPVCFQTKGRKGNWD